MIELRCMLQFASCFIELLQNGNHAIYFQERIYSIYLLIDLLNGVKLISLYFLTMDFNIINFMIYLFT